MSHSAKENGKKGTAAAAQAYFLPCRAEPGMFKGEYLVYLQGYDPYDPSNPDKPIQVQMLADEREVQLLGETPKRNAPVQARVLVTLLGTMKGVAEVILPQPAQPVGERMLVNARDLQTEAAKSMAGRW